MIDVNLKTNESGISRTPKTLVEAYFIISELEQKIENMQSQINYLSKGQEFLDRYLDRKLLKTVREAADELSIDYDMFECWLIRNYFMVNDENGQLKPHKAHSDDKLFEYKDLKLKKRPGFHWYITPKGMITFKLLLHKM